MPQIVSSAFWGGVWGVAFALAQARFPRGLRYWLFALLFGAILPPAVFYSLVAYLKGLPLAAGGDLYRIITGISVNAAWGLGAVLMFRALLGRSSHPTSSGRPPCGN